MFTEKDRKQHSGGLASSFKIRGKHAGNVQRTEQPLDSLQMWQRNLGNQYLNSVNLTGVQPNGLLIQRVCGCGGSCAGCMQREDDRRTLQPKLVVGAPNDQYEQEAERVAEQVMRMPEPRIQRVRPECEEELQRQPREEEEETLQTKLLAEQITPLVQRQSEPMEEEEEEETLQTKPLAEQIAPLVQRQAEPMEDEEEEETLQTQTTLGQTPTVSSSLQNRITALQGGGQPLPHSERAFFEPRFGADFSQVRVHADSQAAETARAVNARAFTVRRDVVFGAGEYQPSTSEGRRLLAHELTHVMQQNERNPKFLNSTKEDIINRLDIVTERRKHPTLGWVKVPKLDRPRLKNARSIVKRAFTRSQCKNYFNKHCPKWKRKKNKAQIVYKKTMLWKIPGHDWDLYGMSDENKNIAYTNFAFYEGVDSLAGTIVHELMHNCGQKNELKCEKALKPCGDLPMIDPSKRDGGMVVSGKATLEKNMMDYFVSYLSRYIARTGVTLKLLRRPITTEELEKEVQTPYTYDDEQRIITVLKGHPVWQTNQVGKIMLHAVELVKSIEKGRLKTK